MLNQINAPKEVATNIEQIIRRIESFITFDVSSFFVALTNVNPKSKVKIRPTKQIGSLKLGFISSMKNMAANGHNISAIVISLFVEILDLNFFKAILTSSYTTI